MENMEIWGNRSLYSRLAVRWRGGGSPGYTRHMACTPLTGRARGTEDEGQVMAEGGRGCKKTYKKKRRSSYWGTGGIYSCLEGVGRQGCGFIWEVVGGGDFVVKNG